MKVGRKNFRLTLLGNEGQLEFTQDAAGLKVKLPAAAPCKYAYVLKITGLKMNPPTWTDSGNPQIANRVRRRKINFKTQNQMNATNNKSTRPSCES